MRWMHVRFFAFAIDRITRSHPEGDRIPLALCRTERNREILVGVAPAALALGVKLGQTAAAGRAVASRLEVRPLDPRADEAALASLAASFFRFSPDLVLDPRPSARDRGAAGLFVEIGRTAARFGGEDAVMAAARELARRLGYRASVAVADRAGAARALTWSRPEELVRLEGAEAGARLRALPWPALEPSTRAAERLRLLGLTTLGELEALPRAGARARLDGELLERLDAVLGPGAETLERFRPAPRFRETVSGGRPSRRPARCSSPRSASSRPPPPGSRRGARPWSRRAWSSASPSADDDTSSSSDPRAPPLAPGSCGGSSSTASSA
ncbi:MAG: hypothetical protein R3F20_17745 [Planctomycetota bacterium]